MGLVPVAHTSRDYQGLRDDHARAIDALNQHIEPTENPDKQAGIEKSEPEHSADVISEKEAEPTRPEKAGRSFPGGPETGGMVNNQQWATQYNQTVNAGYFAYLATNSGERNQAEIDNAPTNAEHDAAKNELYQAIDGQERGGQPIEGERGEPGHEAAKSELDNHVDRAEAVGSNLEHQQDVGQQPEKSPAIAEAWDAWEARVEHDEAPQRGGEQESLGHDAASDALNRHIESPDLQPEAQQPGPEIEV